MAVSLHVMGRNGSSPETEALIDVVLADDHALMRRSMRELLEGEPEFSLLAEAGDVRSAARQVADRDHAVVVLDLHMPGGGGVETVRALRDRAPDAPVVIITLDDSPVFAQRLLGAGAAAIVSKDVADSELAPAVRAAARGERYVSPHIAARMEGLERALSDQKLSQREVEVLRLIALGHTSVEIARQLHLSPRTIETHRAHIHRKLGLATRADLVRYALDRGLIGT